MIKPDISVILTFHNEGIVIHKTFLSLKRMLEQLDKNKVSYEVIAHIDNGDERTRDYLARHKDELSLNIFENSFGSPSLSRNFAVEQANGKYVCLMDGDDLFSEFWLLDSYNILENTDEKIILHPEFNITFGINEQPRLWHMKDSMSLSEDLLILLGRNRWCSGTFLRKSLAIDNPYIEATGCYGYEDWWYNCETRAKNIKPNVTPNSILFYRVREDSTYHLHSDAGTTIPYSNAFSFDKMNSVYDKQRISDNVSLSRPKNDNRALQVLRIGHKILRHTPVIRRADAKIMRKIEARRSRKVYASLPEYVINEWKNINTIDSSTYPDPEIVSRMPFYSSEVSGYGEIFCKIMHELKKTPDYIFAMPFELSIGGTEKVLVNYLQAISEIHPKWHILVLGKLPDNHSYNIPSNVVFIDFNPDAFNCNSWDLGFLLTKLIIQSRAKRIHIVNNEFCYRWAISNKSLLQTNNITVNASFFMDEFTKDKNRIQSFADPFLVELEPCLNKIFADNATIVNELMSREGFSSEKFSVHYQPVLLTMRSPKESIKKDIHKILWASRIAPQKRPDLLKAISESLPDGFSIDVYGRIDETHYSKNYFKGCKNINYKGFFDNISNLPIDEYDAYLYTSQTDGIPNILLEVSALGLPIVASKEGGVPDFIEDGISGRLVDIEDIDGYVDALMGVINSKDSIKYVKKAQEKIRKRHNWKSFVDEVKKDI